MHGNYIHIALAQNNISASGCPGKIQPVQISSFVKHRRLRRIQILGLTVSHNTAPEADHPVVQILNGVHDPVPELADKPVLLGDRGQPCLPDQLVRKSLASQVLYQLGPVFPRIAQAKLMNGLMGQLPLFQIFPPFFASGAAELEIEKLCRLLIDLQKPGSFSFPPSDLLVVLYLRQRYAGPVRQQLHRLGKGVILIIHHKSIYISSCPAAETVIHLFCTVHRKGRCLLVMKGTAAPMVAPFFLKLYISRDHIHYIIFQSDLFYELFRIVHPYLTFGSSPNLRRSPAA